MTVAAFLRRALALVVVVLLYVFLISSARAETYRAEVVSVYDGDTFRADVSVWPSWTVRTAIRVRGIDTPEIRGRCDEEKTKAKQARKLVADWLAAADVVRLVNVEPGMTWARTLSET